nr:MAG TPA: hypothetical protein [Caudoviricetes sp.]
MNRVRPLREFFYLYNLFLSFQFTLYIFIFFNKIYNIEKKIRKENKDGYKF